MRCCKSTLSGYEADKFIVKAKLDSPSRPKFRKKNTSEPTVTIHTKAATDDIYDIFNAPLKPAGHDAEESDDYDSDNYTTDAESTCTTRQVDDEEEEEEEEDNDNDDDDDASDVKSEWSDFDTRKHLPGAEDGQDDDHSQVSDLIDTSNPGRQEEYDDDEDDDDEPRTRTSFVPIPPEDWDMPTRPYRDAAEMANNRLPFMTPITERTEMSLDVTHYKTPCKRGHDASTPVDEEDGSDLEPPSSPLCEIVSEGRPSPKVSGSLAIKADVVPLGPKSAGPLVPKSAGPLAPKSATPLALKSATPLAPKSAAPLGKALGIKPLAPKGPIVKEQQCNPVDEAVRADILANMQPPLRSYFGFFDHRHERYEGGSDIRKFAKAMSKAAKSGSDRTGLVTTPVVVEFPDSKSTYTVKKELGAGAYAPVYLVENSSPEEDENDENAVVAMGKGAFAVNHRSAIEALKMETPPTPWEFHMMRVVHARLGPQHRAAASLSFAHEMHLYQDEAFLFLPYHPYGTLLDVVNFFRAEPSGIMDEQLAMFFAIELLRTVEALHAKSMLHGDLKADNCLLRLDALVDDQPLSSQWRSDGSGGWSSRGAVLIDFGRSIDMRAFVPDVEFIADWKTSAQDCAEMREGRPWTWQIDYHGLAGTIHTLLFGKYIETVRCDQGGIGKAGRRYKMRESLKRYWQTQLWADCFDLLLNPGGFMANEEGGRMPVLKSMRSVRERMEEWLEANCERGVGLKSLMGKVEAFAKSRR